MIFSVCPGTKIDLREDKEVVGQLAKQGLAAIKKEQGVKMATKIKAYKYLECSALTQKGLKQVREAGEVVMYWELLRRNTVQNQS